MDRGNLVVQWFDHFSTVVEPMAPMASAHSLLFHSASLTFLAVYAPLKVMLKVPPLKGGAFAMNPHQAA